MPFFAPSSDDRPRFRRVRRRVNGERGVYLTYCNKMFLVNGILLSGAMADSGPFLSMRKFEAASGAVRQIHCFRRAPNILLIYLNFK